MLKNAKTRSQQSPLERTSTTRSFLQGEGGVGAFTHEARILDLNLVNHTVDVATVFDQRRFFDVQVCTPYLHPNNGDGISVTPEIGAKCLVHIPSDGPPPFIIGFFMPLESTYADDESDTAPPAGRTPTGASFSGGRTRAKPGDITIKGRDGNFVTLHRGGVLQIGSTPLAQRIFIPLGNLVTDISQNYNHYNSAGAINWGIRETTSNPECEHKQTFRVYANDEFADVRIATGKVQAPVPEPNGAAGSTNDLSALGIGGNSAPVVFELTVAPGGFDGDTGMPQQSAQAGTKLRIFFDRAGGTMLRTESSVSLRVKKKLRLRVDDTIEVFAKKSVAIESETTARLFGKNIVDIATGGGVVRINGGSNAVAHVGSTVRITTTVPVPVIVGGVPGTISAGAIFSGTVTSGNDTVRV